jgi:AcrR family transcriptional regulator
MTRPSECTRERILKTAARLFAERGYDATSIRTLAAKARVNQAAINYHFKTKDGLYREVLREAIQALTEQQLSHAQETQAMPRERALGEFVRQQLRPLSARGDSPGISTSSTGKPCVQLWCTANLSAKKQLRSWVLQLILCAVSCPMPIGPRWSWLPSGWSVSAMFSYATASSWPCHPFRSILMSPG